MHVTSSKNLHNGPTCVKFGIVSCILEIRLQYFKTNNIGNTSSKETDFSKLGWPFRYPISKRSRCSPIFLHFLTRTTHYLAVAKVARTSLKTQYCPLCFTRLCYCPFFLHGSEASIVFRGFAFSLGKHSIARKEISTSRAYGLFKLAILKYVLRYMNKRLTTDMADANRLQRATRPTGFFIIKKITADFCSAQCIMDNTRSLRKQRHLKYRTMQTPSILFYTQL